MTVNPQQSLHLPDLQDINQLFGIAEDGAGKRLSRQRNGGKPMTVAKRIYAGLAAASLVVVGSMAVAPAPARAQFGAAGGSTFIVAAGIVSTLVLTLTLANGNNDENPGGENPQSP